MKLNEIKIWREQQAALGRPSGMRNFYIVHNTPCPSTPGCELLRLHSGPCAGHEGDAAVGSIEEVALLNEIMASFAEIQAAYREGGVA